MSDTQTCHEGGCLCGAIRYGFEGDPLLTAICHCTHCQRQGGSAFSIVCAIPSDSYRQTGTTRVFLDKGDSGKTVERHFCGTCGSPIVSIVEALPGLTIIKAGTLDTPDSFAPTQEVYCEHAFRWMPAVPGTTRVPGSNVPG